jgi:uncharacterized membrane protein
MRSKLSKGLSGVLKGLLVILFLLYPLAVYFGLTHLGVAPVAMLLAVLGLLRMWTTKRTAMWPLAVLALLCGGLSLVFQTEAWLKLYPVAMNAGALFIFAATLFRPPSFIERLARLMEPDLPESGVRWTRRVTEVWCVFFILNGSIALYTALYCSMQVWALYNGLIAYVLMGILLGGEFVLRRIYRQKHTPST